MADFDDITFDGVVGVIVPATVPTVTPVDNPALIHAALRKSGQWHPSTLNYNGWFEDSVAAAAFALVGEIVTAEDETGASRTVLVISVMPHEVPALDAGVLGVWVELSATVQDWPV